MDRILFQVSSFDEFEKALWRPQLRQAPYFFGLFRPDVLLSAIGDDIRVRFLHCARAEH